MMRLRSSAFCSLAVLLALLHSPGSLADQSVGQSCDVVNQCIEGAFCLPMPWIAIGVQRCVPNAGDPLEPANCHAFYNDIVQEAVLLDLETDAFSYFAATYGAGAEAAVGGTASAEIGVAYDTGGRFGCYASTCLGAGVAFGVSVFGTQGKWNRWEDIPGASQAFWAGGGVGLSQVVATVLAPPFEEGDIIGVVGIGSVGLGLDAGAGFAECETSLTTVISRDDVYVNDGATGAADGSEFAPLQSFADGYAFSAQYLDGPMPQLKLASAGNGFISVAPGTYTKKMKITAPDGPVTLFAAPVD